MISFFVFQPYFYGVRAGGIGDSIGGIIGESVNYAPPTYREMGERGYVGFGSLSIREPVGNLNIKPFAFTPPFIKKGCGAIDIGWGGFNFLGFEYLVQKLQQILQAAPAFAFQLALEVFVPQVSQVLSKISAIADMINNINFDACKASSNLVHAIAPSLHDMIFNSRTDEAAQHESKGSKGSFWDTLADAFNLPPADEIKKKFEDLMSSFGSYTSQNHKSPSNPIKLLNDVGSFGVFKDTVAVKNQEYAPPGTYLRFIGSDDYALKTAFIGDVSLRRVVDGSNKVIDIDVDYHPSDDYNIQDFLAEVISCVERNQDAIGSAVKEALDAGDGSLINTKLNISCSIQMPVDGNSSTISFDVGSTIVKPVLSALINYYLSISRGKSLDTTSARWVNFIASMDSSIVRAIKVAALADGVGADSSVVKYLGNIVSSSLVKAVVAEYVMKLITEGCSEMQTVLSVLPKELGQVIPADTSNPEAAARSKAILDAIKTKVLSQRDSIIQICSIKTALANQDLSNIKNEIYVQNRQGLIKLAEDLEKKLVQNLESRGLSTLARYVKAGS
jgi:hypothetical protein